MRKFNLKTTVLGLVVATAAATAISVTPAAAWGIHGGGFHGGGWGWGHHGWGWGHHGWGWGGGYYGGDYGGCYHRRYVDEYGRRVCY